MTGQSKICPKCHMVAPLSAAVCQNCAHQFRTVFAEQASLAQTQSSAVPKLPPTQSPYSPVPPEYMQHYSVPPQPEQHSKSIRTPLDFVAITLICGAILGIEIGWVQVNSIGLWIICGLVALVRYQMTDRSEMTPAETWRWIKTPGGVFTVAYLMVWILVLIVNNP